MLQIREVVHGIEDTVRELAGHCLLRKTQSVQKDEDGGLLRHTLEQLFRRLGEGHLTDVAHGLDKTLGGRIDVLSQGNPGKQISVELGVEHTPLVRVASDLICGKQLAHIVHAESGIVKCQRDELKEIPHLGQVLHIETVLERDLLTVECGTQGIGYRS